MFVRKRAVQLKRHAHRSHRSCSLLANNVLRILSSLIVPLMLGVLTVCITIYQHQEAKKDREEDWKKYELQWRADRNESERHRAQQLNIAEKKQKAQIKSGNDRYHDEVFVAYIKEIGDLMKENNGSLTSNQATAAIARIKTINVLRQLDGSRQIHVIRFLFEARQLTASDESTAISMMGAKLSDIIFTNFTSFSAIDGVSLTGVHLQRCAFQQMLLFYINFTATILEEVSFSDAILRKVDFSSAYLYEARVSSIQLLDINFSSSQILYTNFSNSKFLRVKFLSARLVGSSFSSAKLFKVDFSSDPSCIQHLNVFSHHSFTEFANFSSDSSDLLERDILSRALFNLFAYLETCNSRIDNVDFLFAEFWNVNFLSTDIGNANFGSALFINVSFSFAQFFAVNFSSAILNDVNFSSVQFSPVGKSSNFRHANMPHTIFEKCECRRVDFSYANLSGSVFWNANLENVSFQNADLAYVNFSGANLWNADFTNTTITDSQLQSALSIRNAKLPNGTLGRARNLIKNGDANCNIKSLYPWHVQNGSIMVVASKKNLNDCQFVLQSNVIGATMSQRIHLGDIWDSTLWTTSNVELHLNNSSGISTNIYGLSNNGTVIQKKLYKSMENVTIMGLLEGMEELEVVVKFNASFNNTWCDNIELFINYYM